MNESETITTTSPMLSSARKTGANLVTLIKGDVDLKNSPELRTALLSLIKDHPAQKLILDLSDVTYMDSSAIAVLVEVLRKLKEAGGKVYLVSVQKRVMGLLEIARLDKIFVIAKDEAEAIGR